MDNIHMLTLKPDKWSKSTDLPNIGDVVLFVFNDSSYSKSDVLWKLGKVSEVKPRKITVKYFVKTDGKGLSIMNEVVRNPRDVSIIYSIDQLCMNTKDHHKKLFEP